MIASTTKITRHSIRAFQPNARWDLLSIAFCRVSWLTRTTYTTRQIVGRSCIPIDDDGLIFFFAVTVFIVTIIAFLVVTISLLLLQFVAEMAADTEKDRDEWALKAWECSENELMNLVSEWADATGVIQSKRKEEVG